MISGFLVVVIASVLAIGHIWWGRQVSLKDLEALGNPVTIVASYHARWHHVSIAFLVTAAVSGAHLLSSWANAELLWALWVIILGCWITYLGVAYAYPSMRKLGWGQIVLMLVLLASLALHAGAASGA